MPKAAAVPPPAPPPTRKMRYSLIGPGEAATILDVTVPRVAQLRREGRLKWVRYGRDYLYDEEEIAALAVKLAAERAERRKDRL